MKISIQFFKKEISSSIQRLLQKQSTRKKRIVMTYLSGTGWFISPYIVEEPCREYERRMANSELYLTSPCKRALTKLY